MHPIGQLVNGNQGGGGNHAHLPMTAPHQTLTKCAMPNAIAFQWQSGGDCRGLELRETAFALRASGSHSGDKGDGGMNATTAVHGMAVRRITPRECERLQGFPDDWTAIPFRGKPAEQCPDGPRYKALGNSMAVPVMAWIGRKIAAVDAIS